MVEKQVSIGKLSAMPRVGCEVELEHFALRSSEDDSGTHLYLTDVMTAPLWLAGDYPKQGFKS
jgi:hypothetical protein